VQGNSSVNEFHTILRKAVNQDALELVSVNVSESDSL